MRVRTPTLAVPITAAMVLLLLTVVSSPRAQLVGGEGDVESARLNRPLLSPSVTNAGTHDHFFLAGYGTNAGMAYPRHNKGGGAYGDNILGTIGSSGNRDASFTAVRNGHGVWTLTSDTRVVYTGIRLGMQEQHIVPMQYDVSADPDLSKLGKEIHLHRVPTVKMGNGAGSPSGISETSLQGNWWPGSDLIEVGKTLPPGTKPPVHILNLNLSAYPDDDTWPEQIIITKWTNSQGLTITERVSGWSHPDFDEFFIDEYVIENTGDTDGDGERDLPAVAQNDLFIGFEDRFKTNAAGSAPYRTAGGGYASWRREEQVTLDDWYAYDQNLKLLYNWDGDQPLFIDWDDTGDPYRDAQAEGTLVSGAKLGQPEGQLMSPGHHGVTVIAYTDDSTSPYAYNARDIGQGYVVPEGDQPYAVRMWESFGPQVQSDPNTTTMTELDMYSEVLSGRQIDPNPDHVSGQISMLVFGPYDLPADGKTKIVLAYVSGQPGQMLGNIGPIEWAVKGNQNELPKGHDAQKQNLEAAQFAYDNAFDLPDAPPDVNFRTGSSATATMTVDWPDVIENAAHPDYGSADIAGYRVYRTSWFDIGPYELVADIPAGTTSLEAPAYRVTREGGLYKVTDLRSAAGFFYHYSVRAYAKPHADWTPGSSDPAVHPLSMADLPGHITSHVQVGQEGGWSASTQRIYAAESPFSVPSPETESLSEKIRVVPNPYFALEQGRFYPGSTKLRFVGIPSHCRIRVFSASGDMVSDYLHDNPTKGESDYIQETWNLSGSIASGVYFWVVENLIDGPNKGKIQKGHLVVIR